MIDVEVSTCIGHGHVLMHMRRSRRKPYYVAPLVAQLFPGVGPVQEALAGHRVGAECTSHHHEAKTSKAGVLGKLRKPELKV